MRRRDRNPAQRLRFAVEALPRRTREAMLRGISSNPIAVGAYVDRDSGAICPMLAAHRNGGRTDLASFARAWDRYTHAKRPRVATGRELLTLRSLLESSLARDPLAEPGSLAEAAARIRAERAAIPGPPVSEIAELEDEVRPRPPSRQSRERASELRHRRRGPWMRPARGYEEFRDLLAAAEEQLVEQRAAELVRHRRAEHV